MKSFDNCVMSLFAIAENTIRDAVRQRFFSAVLILALLLVISGLFFQEFDFGASELKFIADFDLAQFCSLVPSSPSLRPPKSISENSTAAQ